ncbi:hypothetical protein FQN60_017428%2C partial [Xyrichtys novacula]|uniref:Uncharacterized protein n=1 Tax=Xyrichtys novacula TaxID=13765 RepID=A0AAV1FQX7_XYRNO|nr:hypothetical protein FQN60_017428%2C partial [Xyrichtys novacula]
MTPSLFLSLFVAAVAAQGRSSGVNQRNSTYHCCDQPAIKFDRHCGNTWSNDQKTFAYYKLSGSRKGCKLPCKELNDGRMLLEKCVEVQVSVVHKKGGGSVMEERISFTPLPCSAPALAPGSVGPLLLLLPVLMMMIGHMISV